MIHKFENETAFLSNFEPVQIEYNGMVYPSVENAYQSAKSDNMDWKTFCLTCEAREVKKKSKDYELVENWEEIKIDVMHRCLIKKFSQTEFMTKLVATGNQNIQEGNYWGDDFWGINLKVNPNVGENHLGRLLMNLRTYFKRYDTNKQQFIGRV